MFHLSQILALVFVFTQCWKPLDSFGISIVDNGYRDISVSFPSNASLDIRKQLIQATKDLFNSSSVVLYVATKRRAYFRNITFIIPRSWGEEAEWLDDNITVHKNLWDLFDKADIAVTDAVSGSKPYTLHCEGCQRQGVRVYLPEIFLISEHNQRYKDLHFIHQWSQFRYGVFEEGGFENDDRFPLYYSVPGSKDVLVTSCTNIPLQYKTTDIEGNDCKPEMDFKAGRPAGTKCLYDVLIQNETLQSSLMYQQSLPQTFKYCDGDLNLDTGHNPATPSKQNTLCQEESAWFVILRNPDFSKGRNQARKFKPDPITFKYVQESNVKVVVALETSRFMQDHNRYNQVKNALSKFILYDLPFASKFGVVHYSNDVISRDFLSTLTSLETRNAFLESSHIPDEAGSSNTSCPMCAVKAGIQMLLMDSEIEGGIVVLVTTGVCEADSEELLKEELVGKRVRLFVILFHNEVPRNCTWETLVSSTGGIVFRIAETASSWTAMDQLYLSFASVIKGYSWTPEEHILIAREMLKGEEIVSLDIAVDKFIGEEIRIFITGPNFDTQNSPLRADFTHVVIGDVNVTEFQRQPFIPAWIFEITRNAANTITFKSKWKKKTFDPVLVTVTGKPLPGMATISARAWFGNSNRQVIANDSMPLKLYAEVTSGNIPIVEADVHGIIYHPDGSIQTSILLQDNGIGDPDVTKYDGIYSSYFSGFSSGGYYTVMLTVSSNGTRTKIRKVTTGNCCGSFMPSSGADPTGSFVRFVGPLSFLRTANQSATDIYPPNRILDLHVIDFDGEQMKCTLGWTAVGENYTEGIASSYQIKVFTDRTDLRRRFGDMGQLITDPRDMNWTFGGSTGFYGSLVQCAIHLPEPLVSDYYYIGVRALDVANNTGAVSNTVQIYVGNHRRSKTPNCEKNEDNLGTWNSGNSNIIAISLLFLLNLVH